MIRGKQYLYDVRMSGGVRRSRGVDFFSLGYHSQRKNLTLVLLVDSVELVHHVLYVTHTNQ